jgi:hypothetical protein
MGKNPFDININSVSTSQQFFFLSLLILTFIVPIGGSRVTYPSPLSVVFCPSEASPLSAAKYEN